MKKLLTLILALALILPAAAMADDDPGPLRIVDHYAVLINSHAGDARTAMGGTMFPDFDSMTLDWFITSDGETSYIMKTYCVLGTFINDGTQKVRKVTLGDKTYLVADGGTHIDIMTDENGDIWMDFGYGFFRMRKVEHASVYKDRK